MRLSAEEFAVLSRLLDVGLDLEKPAREAWLESLVEPFPGAKQVLRKMLAREASGEAEGLLDTLPKLSLAMGEAESGIETTAFQADARVGNYRLMRQIGHGGMGQVWLAEQTAPVRRFVALKLIRAGMVDESVIKRFHSERQSLAIMDHPAIAKVFDAGTTSQGQPYLVMEYVPGLPITEYCDQHRLKICDRLELFIQACEGVQHAHQKAIIHRDLKPANILVVEVDGKPVPRIIDFGLAKPAAPQLTGDALYTQLGRFLGTPGYMSPEQADPNIQDIDTRSDVYSLGVILYVLLTGLQPFETKRHRRKSVEEWLRELREDEPPRLSSRVSADRETANNRASARGANIKQLTQQLHGDLEWIALKALERDRDRRYGTPSELAADLRRYLNDEPVLARPANAGYQIRKFVRRHRIAAGFIATSTTLAILASIAALIAVSRGHEAEHQAERALQAQSRLLIEVAAQRLKASDVARAQGIILEVLMNPELAHDRSPAAISAFQEIRAADGQQAVLTGHCDVVLSAVYSPDGTRIVTASFDKTARIWDARTGVQLTVLAGHGEIVVSAGYSPDGLRIVTASADKTARIWDAQTGAQLAVLSGHGDRVNSAAYSPDGTRIVTASADKTARIWDTLTGTPLAVLSGHGGRVTAAAYSPDGTRIVTASWDKTARIWDARSGKQLMVLSGHSQGLWSASYSADNTRIVTASGDETARIWDAQTGAQLAVLSGGNFLTSAAYSPDGSRIVTASRDRTARIFDARTGAQLAVLSGHGNFVESAAYSPDGTRIVTASADKTARIWDARTGASLAVLFGHGDVVDSVVYSPDGSRIVTASADKTARIWDARTGAQLAVLSGHGNFVESAAYSPDGTRIVTASDDKTARIWDARTGAQLAVLSGHGDRVNSAAYSPDGARIVTASLDRTARTWDAHVPADIEAQILWVSSAQTDPLPDEVKSQLGLPPDPHQRTWATRGSACDQAVAAVYDPDRVAPGVSQASINVDIAKAACAQSITQPQHGARSDYQMGRTLLAMGKLKDAKQQFELAVSKGYRAARIDLAQLLVNSSANYSDFERAVALYELAWKESVPIAAFELGHLYEYGAQGTTTAAAHVLQPDISRAWSWYQKGADAGEPNALGRFAERAETAAMTETHPQKTNADLLDAFRYYAAAAMHAHDEDWPDETWRHWRYRRATLARLLAQEGLMPQVAAAYDAVREPTMARAPTRWEKIRSMLRL